MSTFTEDFLLQLRAELARVLGLPAAAIYTGREPQKVTRVGFEVWVKTLPLEPHPEIKVHMFEVHVRLRSRREENQTGADQQDAVAVKLDDLRERFDGTRPFVAAIPSLVAVQVDPGTLDNDPDDSDLIDGTLVLRVLEH